MENQATNFRYEKKFYTNGIRKNALIPIIKLNPALFIEIFQRRYINNIYLDTDDFYCYRGNVNGNDTRVKFRIRWYGKLFGKIDNPILELKIKKGLLGTKQYYPLPHFWLDENFCWNSLKKDLITENFPLVIRDTFLNMQPVLLNRYARNYYLTYDKKIRLTLDDE